jgi:inosine-uridine nucleoside N-ribohydrolase
MGDPMKIAPVAALSLITLVALEAAPVPVWIDTDPWATPGGHEVDDAIALLQAFASPELAVRGVSLTYGNADLPTASVIGRKIVSAFGPAGLPVFDGAAGPGDLGKETDATRAIADALRRERLTILVLGPGTDVATVVKNHPELAARVVEIIAVAARRPGQKFLSGPRQITPFRDYNFELDPKSFQVLLDTRIPLTFAPWEISSKVWLTHEDIAAVAQRRPAAQWLVPALGDWLALWNRQFGTDGFNPFDALAVGYLVARRDLTCEQMSAKIETRASDTSSGDKPYLVVRGATSSRTVRYCFDVAPDFKRDLLNRLKGG